jgi:dolichol kinase
MALAKGAVAQGISFFVLIVAFQIAASRVALEKEAKRRWQHALTGHALVQVSYMLSKDVCIGLLLLGALGMVYLRFFQSELYYRLFENLLRVDEMQNGRLPGAFYFLVGTALTALFFPMATARYAVECLSLADPAAAWIGGSISSPRVHSSASVVGCLACFVTAVVLGALYIPDKSIVQILVGGLTCCIVEAFSFRYDNLLIPILTAAAVHYTSL